MYSQAQSQDSRGGEVGPAHPGLQAATHGVVLVAVDVLLRAMSNAPMSVVEPTMRTVDAAAIAGYRGLLRMMVRDPRTRAALTPDYGPIAKRPTANTGYLLSFNRDNVELVTTPIERFTENGIRTTDGTEREFDMIVLATGYHVFSDPETYTPGMVVGQDGMDLGKFYAENGLQAYESVSLPSLPNRWTLVGPYSWSGSGWHAFVEMTADHAVRAISRRGDGVRPSSPFDRTRTTPITAISTGTVRRCASIWPSSMPMCRRTTGIRRATAPISAPRASSVPGADIGDSPSPIIDSSCGGRRRRRLDRWRNRRGSRWIMTRHRRSRPISRGGRGRAVARPRCR